MGPSTLFPDSIRTECFLETAPLQMAPAHRRNSERRSHIDRRQEERFMAKTKEIIADYWDKKIPISVPEGTIIPVVPDPPLLPEPEAAIRKALENPIGAPPLSELAKAAKGGKIVIAHDDLTRPCPAQATDDPDHHGCAEQGRDQGRGCLPFERKRQPLQMAGRQFPDSFRRRDLQPVSSFGKRFQASKP